MSSPEPVAFHVMTKPIGPICNLDCSYCFYLHKEELFPEAGPDRFRMSQPMLETYVKQYIEAQDVPRIEFAWQGGEPTLLGVDFFRKAVEFQKQYCPAGKEIANAFQTNGVLLDDEWGEFLAANDFLVGISIDGPEALHDKYRVDKGGQPTFPKVMRGRDVLRKHGVRHNGLCVVNRHNGDRPLDVYRFFREEGFEWVQFIPAVERLDFKEKSPGSEPPPMRSPADFVTAWSVLPVQYGKFLEAVFDEWVRNDVGRVYVQLFEECVAVWMGMEANLCVFKPTCGKALAIEHDGGLFSCDHFVYEDFKLGNITETHIRELATSDAQRKFGQDKNDALPRYCRECEVRFMCNGACPKDRFISTPDGEPGLNYLCAGYKRFFNYIDPYMRGICDRLRSRRPAEDIMAIVRGWDAEGRTRHVVLGEGGPPRAAPAGKKKAGRQSGKRPSRNAPCPCGSGKKFKACCGAATRK